MHRDLKPLNVLVSDDGRAVLMDFGIARGDAPSGETDQAQIVGTPEYMAPEQVRAGKVDARADLYALGCVGYWLLTGTLVFTGETALTMLAAHVRKPPDPPSRRRPSPQQWRWRSRRTDRRRGGRTVRTQVTRFRIFRR